MGRKAVRKARNTDPKRKKKYLLKLLPIFYDYGLQQLSMDDISAKLNISKATLYNYFATKEEMVAGVIAHVLGEIATFAPILSDQERPFMDRYLNAIQVLIGALTDVSTVMLRDVSIHYPRLYESVKNFREFAAGELEKFYLEGKEKGILAGHNTNILVLSDRLFFDALTQPEVLEANDLTLKEAFQEYFDMKCFGMISEEARHDIGGKTKALLADASL